MEQQLDTLDKKILVEIVKLTQTKEMKGTKGDWKGFLSAYDKKLGASVSDPSRRTKDVLVAFLKTLCHENDVKILSKVLQCYANRNPVAPLKLDSPENEPLQQRLVLLTMEHPLYPMEFSFPSYEEGWVVTNLSGKSRQKQSKKMFAVDCEMVLCQDGTEALVRVSVVDRDLQVKLDAFVKPDKPVADYRSDITGVTAKDLEGVSCSLADVQKSLKKILSHGRILVGHSLYNDLKALKLDHTRVIDTSFLFKYCGLSIHRRPSLNNLSKLVLGYEVRENGAPHNSLDDARAAMKLVLALIERGIDDDILFIEDVPVSEVGKLYIHGIPVKVPIDELHRAIPGEYNLEKKPSKNAFGNKYSAFAIFKRPEEAQKAFEILQGSLEEDSFGNNQKLVIFEVSSGVPINIHVRVATGASLGSQASEKKRAPVEEPAGEKQKKLKVERKSPCEDHLEEIKEFDQELSHKNHQPKKGCGEHTKEIEKQKPEQSEKKKDKKKSKGSKKKKS
ncbi:hypothetical protein SAY87_026867 [Trapa incisa]|uniref:Exonuclease domain-containing protein n=1 Tax=Trapa incisa TaxID=236973 RepID=A0AAN7GYH0_9MYRT|nr:hypothetical protein SAY87_026867 [Trapa incisa]